jgi:hypothetical protein
MASQSSDRPPVNPGRTDELLQALDSAVSRLRYLAAVGDVPARVKRELLWISHETAAAAARSLTAAADTAVIPDDELVDLDVRPDGTPF